MEEGIRNEIIEKVDEYGYKSAKFRLALVKEESFWKILAAHIILDISDPKEDETFLKEESFVLEDIHVPISEFKKFIDHLGHVNIGKISPEGKATINKQVQFTVGKYDLCFVGNFPGNDFSFFGRKVGIDHYGISKPFYFVWYAIHQSVTAKKYPKLDLTGAEIPLRNVTEALNHFWGTNYEEHSLSHQCNIYMPIFEASISEFNINNNNLELKFEIDPKRAKIEDLSLGLIAENKSKSYRKKHSILENKYEVDLGFIPHSVNAYLNHKGKRIDEYNFYNYQSDNVTLLNRGLTITESPGIIVDDEHQDFLLDSELVSKMPTHVQAILFEAEDAFKAGLNRAAVMLFRSAIEEGITLVLKKIGMGEKMYNEKNFEMRLGKKIQTITTYVPSFNQVKEELELLKWFGDKATHEVQMPFKARDISNNLEPKLRLILTKMVEELN